MRRCRAEQVVALLAPVADALDRAHAAGLVHSRFSAHSLLLAGRERLMLDTFGLLASEHDGEWNLLGARDLRYISPEQVRGLPAGPASNVYSLTALAVHALTGEPPFTGDQPAMMYAHLVNEPEAVSSRRPDLGRRLDGRRGRRDGEGAGGPAAVRHGARPDARRRAGSKRPEASSRPVPVAPLRLVTEADSPVAPGRRTAPGRRPPRGGRRRGSVAAGAVAAMAVAPFGDDASASGFPSGRRGRLEQLAGKRAELRDQLAAADTPKAQAEAATALGDLYGRAARTGGRPRSPRRPARRARHTSGSRRRPV